MHLKYFTFTEGMLIEERFGDIAIDHDLNPDYYHLALTEFGVDDRPFNVREIISLKTQDEVNACLTGASLIRDDYLHLLEIKRSHPKTLKVTFTREFEFDLEMACDDAERRFEELTHAEVHDYTLTLEFNNGPTVNLPASEYVMDADYDDFKEECFKRTLTLI